MHVNLSLGYGRNGSSNLSFTPYSANTSPDFLEKVGGLWFLASEKRLYGTEMGLGRYFGAEDGAMSAYLGPSLRPHELGCANPSFPGWIACLITQPPTSPLLMR